MVRRKARGAGPRHSKECAERGPQLTNVLTSWKEIANYMGKGVRTVQRWERQFGFPIRRPVSLSHKAVLALPEEIDVWLRSRTRAQAMPSGSTDEYLLAEIDRLRAENAELRLRLIAVRTGALRGTGQPESKPDRSRIGLRNEGRKIGSSMTQAAVNSGSRR